MRLQTTTEGLNMLRYGKDPRRRGGGMEENMKGKLAGIMRFFTDMW